MPASPLARAHRERLAAASRIGRRAGLALAASLMASTSLAQSAWNEPGAGDWTVGANWDPAGEPTAATDVVIENGGEAQITVPGAAAATITIGGTAGTSGALTITAGGTLTSGSSSTTVIGGAGTGTVYVSRLGTDWTLNGDLVIGGADGGVGSLAVDMSATAELNGTTTLGDIAGSQGELTVDGSGTIVTTAGVLTIGNSGTGTLSVSSSGELDATDLMAGVLEVGSGNILVTGQDSLLKASGTLTVGDAGTGGLRIEAAAAATAANAVLGGSATGSGTATVTGAGSAWTIDDLLTIGKAGSGGVTIEAGGALVSTDAVAGDASTGSGTIRVTGQDSSWTTSGTVTLGNEGTGGLTVEASGQVVADNVTLGAASGGSGTVDVTGAGSTLEATTALVVGDAGSGSIDINSAGSVTAGSATLGQSAGGSGEIDVSGIGSELVVTDALIVGAAGTGELSITLGGAVSAGSAAIGAEAGGGGRVALTDDGSALDVTGTIAIGGAGTGELDIANGASVTAADAVIGVATGGSGSVVVSNDGSTLAVSNSLTIGAAGTGGLTVDAGGTVTAADAVIGSDAGGTGSVLVNASGSDLALSGALTVGLAGTGSLDVTAGGTVESSAAVIGDAATGIGTVTVDGLGSVWTVDGGLTIGNAGSGTLLLTGLGTVEVGGGSGIVALAAEAGSTGRLVIGDGGGTLAAAEVTGGAGTATIEFAQNDTTVTFAPAITGTTSLVQSGWGWTVLTGANLYSGTTTVEAGTLAAGAEGAFSPNSDVTVAANGVLDLAGYGQTVASLTNAGIVSLVGGSAGTVLTIAGDYRGEGGSLALASVLAADDSPTDRLVVQGDASGSTRLAIVNLDGEGAQTLGDGIEIVSVAGLSTSDAFTLGRTIAGAYDYRLYRGGAGANAGDGNWYLRSDLSIAAQTYRAYPATLVAYGNESIGTLAERTGGWSVGAATTTVPGGAFVRGAGLASNATPDAGSPFSQDLAFLQTGIAAELPIDAPGMITAGVTATFGRSNTNVDAATHGVAGSGRIDSNAYGFGGTLTWWGRDGTYADAVGQLTYFDTGISASDAGQLAGGTDAYGGAFSLEVGKDFEAAPSWHVVPQAQLVYASVGFDDFQDADGTRVGSSGGDSFVGRAGLRLEHSGFIDALALDAMRYNAYVIGNLYYSFLGDTGVTVGNTTLSQPGDSLAGEIGIGGSLGIGARTSLFGQAGYALAFDGGGDAWSGSFGLRVQW